MRMFLALLGLLFLAVPVEAGGYPGFAPRAQFAPSYAPAFNPGLCAPQAPIYQAPVQVIRQPVYVPAAPAFVPSYGVGASFQKSVFQQRRGFLGRTRQRTVIQQIGY